jgi:hypothetical protein
MHKNTKITPHYTHMTHQTYSKLLHLGRTAVFVPVEQLPAPTGTIDGGKMCLGFEASFNPRPGIATGFQDLQSF